MSQVHSPADIIAQAIVRERQANLLYRMMAELVSDPQMRDKLGWLADEEQLHGQTLIKLYREITDEPVPAESQGEGEGPLGLFDLRSSSLHDVLEFALANEVGAIASYEGEAAHTDDRTTRRLWLLLAEAERGHASFFRHALSRLEPT